MTHRHAMGLALLPLLILGLAGGVASEIYRWADDAGQVHFTDNYGLVPPEYRRYGVLRRYPVALARMAKHHVAASVEAARQGFRTARTDLRDIVPPHGIDVVLDVYRREGTRLVRLAQAVELVELAMRGTLTPDDPEYRRRFTPKL